MLITNQCQSNHIVSFPAEPQRTQYFWMLNLCFVTLSVMASASKQSLRALIPESSGSAKNPL